MSRIVLKMSGEALKEGNDLISNNKLGMVYETIKLLQKRNHKIAIVVGGGNIYRGREHEDLTPITRDTIGMLATVGNALFISEYLKNKNINSIVSTPFDFPYLMENFNDDELLEKYNSNNIVIFGGGLGKSGYSTDSACYLASKKLKSDIVIKLTNVDGVYEDDPKNNPNLVPFDKLTYDEVIKNEYKVMDLYAFKNLKELGCSIIVMNFNKYKEINNIIENKNGATFIGDSLWLN